jgi:hypothetical protein
MFLYYKNCVSTLDFCLFFTIRMVAIGNGDCKAFTNVDTLLDIDI